MISDREIIQRRKNAIKIDRLNEKIKNIEHMGEDNFYDQPVSYRIEHAFGSQKVYTKKQKKQLDKLYDQKFKLQQYNYSRNNSKKKLRGIS